MSNIIPVVKINFPNLISDTALIQWGTVIGFDVHIGAYVTIDPEVKIGSNCRIMNHANICGHVEIQNKVFIGPGTVFTNEKYPRAYLNNKSFSTIVKTGASLGANVTVRCGITIGKYAMVGAGSVVTKDIPNHAKVFGNPAELNGYACWCGNPLTLVGMSCFSTGHESLQLECKACKKREMSYKYYTDKEGNAEKNDR